MWGVADNLIGEQSGRPDCVEITRKSPKITEITRKSPKKREKKEKERKIRKCRLNVVYLYHNMRKKEMKRKERFETLIALAMLMLSAAIAIMSVSLDLPIVTYFFIGMVLLFAAIVIANLYESGQPD